MAQNLVSLDVDGSEFSLRPFAICNTAAATASKVVNIDGFELCDGATVAVKFNYANTASAPGLNVNNTGNRVISGHSDGLKYGKIYEFMFYAEDNTWYVLNSYVNVTNNLTSTATGAALSAAQGKALNDKFSDYLPKTGGTITGSLSVNEDFTATNVTAGGNISLEGRALGNWIFDQSAQFDGNVVVKGTTTFGNAITSDNTVLSNPMTISEDPDGWTIISKPDDSSDNSVISIESEDAINLISKNISLEPSSSGKVTIGCNAQNTPLEVNGKDSVSRIKFSSSTTSLGGLGFSAANTPVWISNDFTESIPLLSSSNISKYVKTINGTSLMNGGASTVGNVVINKITETSVQSPTINPFPINTTYFINSSPIKITVSSFTAPTIATHGLAVYSLIFSPSSTTTLVVPSSVKWMNGAAPVFEVGYIYEVSFMYAKTGVSGTVVYLGAWNKYK